MTLDNLGDDPFVEDFLEHFGVKGMKWGVRKQRNEKARAKQFGKKSDTQEVKTTVKKKTNLSKLSDKQLKAQVNRMQNEKQFKQLSNERAQAAKSRGRKFMEKQFSKMKKSSGEAAKNFAKDFASAAATKLGEMVVEAAFNAATGGSNGSSGAADYATATIDRAAIGSARKALSTGKKIIDV